MNKQILQKIILSFLLTVFLPTNCMMDAIKNFSYKCVENQIVYPIGVMIIDIVTTALPHCAAWIIHSTIDKEQIPIVCEHFQTKAQQRLDTINSELLKREALLINALYDDYNISTEQRIAINLIIDQAKKYERKYQSKPHEEITHEIQISSHFATICATNNINPKSIKTVNNPTQGKHDATTTNLVLERTLTNNIANIKNIIAPPIIEFFPSFFQHSQEMQDFLWTHEGRHLVCQHTTIQSSLIWAIAQITTIPCEKIQDNQNYLLLKIEHERQAEIFYNNAQLASMTRSCRRKGYYENNLFLKHYAQLAEIDESYKFTDRLKNYKPNPMQELFG